MKEQADVNRGGALNEGYDDQNYDYILHGDEIFAQRYILKHRIGKVCSEWVVVMLLYVTLNYVVSFNVMSYYVIVTVTTSANVMFCFFVLFLL